MAGLIVPVEPPPPPPPPVQTEHWGHSVGVVTQVPVTLSPSTQLLHAPIESQVLALHFMSWVVETFVGEVAGLPIIVPF